VVVYRYSSECGDNEALKGSLAVMKLQNGESLLYILIKLFFSKACNMYRIKSLYVFTLYSLAGIVLGVY